ncbi:MAG: response regulator transcription factor [Thermotogae bacterium]|nr:response regulator transcription factor [Thermotogota bacterium]MDD8040983.1 response regulator transcription factor [Thermotogota bacterium]MDD8053941.1 response regulator transcription factor [Thermotogota bacterium]HQN22294.1 response regulator transcription factor [Thermotogota bacterium]
MIRLLIVDDEKLIREGLKVLLGVYEDIQVVGSCSNGLEALRFCRQNPVDVVLMDIRMERCDGVEGTRLIKEMNPAIKVIILTTFQDEEYIFSALSLGASGYLLKDSSSDRIYEAVRNAFMGNVAVHPDIVKRMIKTKEAPPAKDKVKIAYQLTDKELELIQYICRGLSNKEIGEKLFLTEGTVKNNIGKILSKLNLRDRTQIIIFAFQNHLVES